MTSRVHEHSSTGNDLALSIPLYKKDFCAYAQKHKNIYFYTNAFGPSTVAKLHVLQVQFYLLKIVHCASRDSEMHCFSGVSCTGEKHGEDSSNIKIGVLLYRQLWTVVL